MKFHDPYHVAHLAAIILSSRPEPEAHHIRAAVTSARAVLDEAHRAADQDVAMADVAAATVDAKVDEAKADGDQGQQ